MLHAPVGVHPRLAVHSLALTSPLKGCSRGRTFMGVQVLRETRLSLLHEKEKGLFKVPEGHHPRGTTLREEICLSEGSAEVSQRDLRGLSEGSAGSLRGSVGFSEVFRG